MKNPVFTPNQIPEQVLWLDADEPNTIIEEPISEPDAPIREFAVSEWYDKNCSPYEVLLRSSFGLEYLNKKGVER